NCFLHIIHPPPSTTVFPYTTLFRSKSWMRTRRSKIGMKDRNIPRMIKSPWLPEELDGKKVRVKAVTPYGLEFEGVTGIRTSGLKDRKSTRLNSSHQIISYAVFCFKK